MPPQAALNLYGVGVERTHAHTHTTIATQTMTDKELVTDLSAIRNSLSKIESVIWDGSTRERSRAMDDLRHNIQVLGDIIELLRPYDMI